MCKRHQGSTLQTESVGQRAGCRQNSTNNSSYNTNKISVIGKGKYCLVFTDPKDRQVKHYILPK